MDSMRKSLQSHGSYKHTRKISTGEGDQHHEAKPILFDQDDIDDTSSLPPNPREFIVKIDGNTNTSSRDVMDHQSNNKIWNINNNNNNNIGNEFNFHKIQGSSSSGNNISGDDPPSRLIGQFLNKQQEAGMMSLDMDLEMDELKHHDQRNLSPIAESPSIVGGGGLPPSPYHHHQYHHQHHHHPSSSSKEVRVSFQQGSSMPPLPPRVEIAEEKMERHCKVSSDEEDNCNNHNDRNFGGYSREEVLKCTSRASSFRRSSILSRVKTKSRLMDPPEDQQVRRSTGGRSGQLRSGLMKSGQLKSGFMVKNGGDDDEEDPFAEEDIPDNYKKGKITLLIVAELVSLILILVAFVCSLSIPVLVRKTVWELHLWKWELFILVLICGRLLSDWGIRLAVFIFERNFLLRKRVLYFVYGIRKPVTNCIWLGLVLIAWHFIFDKKVKREMKTEFLTYVTKVLICLLVGTLIWLVKTLLVKVLASSFHVSTYFDRIQDSLFNQYVIETLSGPPLVELTNTQEDEEKVMAEIQKLQNAGINVPSDFRDTAFSTIKSGRIRESAGSRMSSKIGKSFRYPDVVSKRQEEGITIEQLHKLNQKNVSAWNMKRLMKIVRQGVLSTLDEKIVDSTHEDESTMQIRSEFEAKGAAKRIFTNVARPRAKYIYLEDLMRFMIEDEASKTMSLFEGAVETKRVSKSALKEWVVNAFRERRALALTLNDTKTAVKKLHNIVNVIVAIIITVAWLLILGIATTHILVLISSQLLLVVFIFGNTCKMIFEAIIFLFVMHPFDVGDRCEIESVQMVVEEMNILNTVFLRYDNQKIFYPNSILATLPISNYYRSPDMGDAIDFCIHISTPIEKVAIMRQRIIGFIENKKDHWYPKPMVVLREMEDMNRLKMAIWLQHRMNHQNMGERWTRRELVVEEMIKVFKELDIEYRMLPLDVNVRGMPTVTSTRLPSNWAACAN